MKCIVLFLLLVIGVALANEASTNTNNNAKVELKTNSALKTNVQAQAASLSKVKVQSNSQNAKSHSIMELMGELKTEKPKKKSKKAKKSKKPKVIKIKRKTFKNPVKVLVSGWLKVSTPNFKKANRFPGLKVPTKKKKFLISSTKDYFRINTDYKKGNSDKAMPSNKFDFWFRLSGKNLYYTSNKNNINVLGVIPVRHMIDSNAVVSSGKGNNKNCFRVRDRTKTNWLLCAKTTKLRDKFVCSIKDILGLDTRDCRTPKIADVKPPIIKTVIKPVIYIPLASKSCNDSWNYIMKGNDWNCDCAEGKSQSPINLPPAKSAIDSPVKPLFQYEEVDPSEESEDSDVKKLLKLEYSDWALRLKYDSLGRIVTLDGAVFSANEIVFHTPSEHTIDGKKYDMEMQIIHNGVTKGDISKQVVLCFLFEKKAGTQNKFIDDLDFFDLPNPLHKTKILSRTININKLFYEVKDNEYPTFRPFSFYTYSGSLTAPPCLENTIVYVASKPLNIGTTALQMFQEVSRIPDQITSTGSVKISHFNPMNSRRTQPLNGRAVFYFDHIKHCGPDPVNKKVKKSGHYEKVIRKKTDYFFVNGMNPSGLPGAYVVPDKEALGNK